MGPQVDPSVTWLPEDSLEGGKSLRRRFHHRCKFTNYFFPLLGLVTIIFFTFRWTNIVAMDSDIQACNLSKFLLHSFMPVFLLRVQAPLR